MIRTLSLFLILSSTIKAEYLVNSLKLDKGTWHRQVIYYPQIDEPSSKLPIVIISHGNGHHYEQYSYLQKYLASQGFITMSHSNRTGPGINSASMTTLENTDIFLEELASLDDGKIAKIADTSRIAWIGHSRGGEGVVRAYTKLMNGEFVAENFTVQTIKLISSIAPTTFLAADEVNPAQVNYHMFVGGADGDVSGRPSSVVMSMPIFERAIGQKQLTYVQGAGHNVFNDDGYDEGSGPDRLEREQVHLIAKAYYLALMKTYLSEDLNWLKYLEGHNTIIRPAKLSFDYIISNEFHIAKNRPETYVIDDFQLYPQLNKASSLAVVDYNVENTYEGTLQDQDSSFRFAESDFMNGMTRYIDGPLIPQGVVFDWSGDEFFYRYQLNGTLDCTKFKTFSFRGAQISQHPLTIRLGDNLSFSVFFEDAKGEQSVVDISSYGIIMSPYARNGGWANEFNTIRIPVSDFLTANPSIELNEIKSIGLLFGSKYGHIEGRVALDDIQLEE